MIVYSYGFKPDREYIPLIEAELRKANKYRNLLLEHYLNKVKAYRALRLVHFPELAPLFAENEALKAKLAELREKLCTVPKAQRDTHPEAQAVRDVRTAYFAKQKEISDKLKPIELAAREPADLEFERRFAPTKAGTNNYAKRDVRNEIYADMLKDPQWSPFWKAAIQLEQVYKEACTTAREHCDLAVGTYIAVEDAHLRAVKTSKTDPHFHRFSNGKLGHQVSDGMYTDSMLVLSPEGTERGEQKNWYRCRMNIGKVSKPVWIEGRLTLHRQLPFGAKIKWVYFSCRQSGDKRLTPDGTSQLSFEYRIQFTLDHTRTYTHGQGTCAINIGWRRLNSGDVRVGYGVDDQGTPIEIKIPAKLVHREQRAHAILSMIDNLFNDFKARVKTFLLAEPDTVPSWFHEECQHIHTWRVQGRLTALSERWAAEHMPELQRLRKLWCAERLGRGETLGIQQELWTNFEDTLAWARQHGHLPPLLMVLEWWRVQHAHLLHGARRMQRNNSLRRQEIYRVAAKRLSERYATVIVGPYDLKPLIKKPNVEDDTRTPQMENASKLRQIAAPGHLKETLQALANAEKGITKDITVAHFTCGHKTKSDAVLSVELWCDHCKTHYDQDANAALHLHQRARQRLSLGFPPSTPERQLTAAE